MTHYGPLIAGKMYCEDRLQKTLLSPVNGSFVATITQASKEDVLEVIERQEQAFIETKNLSAYDKSQTLKKIAALIDKNRDELAETITKESAKPIAAAKAEVTRAIYTFQVAAEEAMRVHGEMIRLDTLSHHNNRLGHQCYVPLGPVTGITPFNFPLNLVAHKIAPAIAAGNPIVIKPAPQTPLTAIKLGELIIEAGWPIDAISILPCENEVAEILVTDPRMRFFSFTGSDAVGWHLKRLAYKKPATLELGGNAANIVHHDANLSFALSRILWGGFFNAGQTCVSAQRIFVHEAVYDAFREKLIKGVSNIVTGDPMNEKTIVGPLINEKAADKVMRLIEDAIEKGATCLAGGKREYNLIQPTLIESDNDSLDIVQEEIFGPVLLLTQYKCFETVIRRVNQSRYGLQAGLFTRDLYTIKKATDELQVGGLNINDVSTFRIDHMPYGGVKDSGCGREGLKYAIKEMMEMKFITYNYPDEEKTS